MAQEQVQDRRVRKTKGRLRDALVSLIHEKSYDSIVVKEILQRADIGRTAFYSHFRDKDALLDSGIHQVLDEHRRRSHGATARPFSDVLWFSLPVFEYVEQFRKAAGVHMDRHGRTIVHEHLRQVVIEQIGDDVQATVGFSSRRPGRIPTDLLTDYLAATFVLVLNWWVESASSLSPQQVDEVFLALVVPTLAAEVERT
jgi:AcrR family transcriptional regulator